MSQFQKYLDKNLEAALSEFLECHGKAGLIQALQSYSNMQQEYICKTKNSMSRIKMSDILYLEIHKHTITIHTDFGTYQKRGSLNNELKILPLIMSDAARTALSPLGRSRIFVTTKSFLRTIPEYI